MFGSTILDIAIGLVFVYLLLSLVCTAAREIVEGWMRHRAKDMESSVKDILGNALANSVYTHGLITALSPGGEKPSYIPSQTFALALMDALATGGAANALTAPAAPGRPAPAPLPALVQSVANIPALRTLIQAAGADAVRVRENIEGWFNNAMDRVSGVYKRRTQKIILFMGLFIVCLVNADSVQIANTLSHDAALRATLVASAQEYAKSDPTHATGQKPEEKMKSLTDEIGKLGLPLGWHGRPGGLGKWVEKVLGLLVTALAISLGAPFWFDLLNRVINIRSSLKPPTK